MREIVFVSHANPEDNRFALWLTLRLVREGYQVFCDLTGLLGGEDFWRDIEIEIRERTIKFLSILSRASNEKGGPRQELRIAKSIQRAETIRDFIIPLRIDDLPHSDVNIELAGLNAIDFGPGRWVPGFGLLMEKLGRDGVPKGPQASPSIVTGWWRSHYSATQGVLDTPEDYLSNWFAIIGFPKYLYVHQASGTLPPEDFLMYPAVRRPPYLITFAPATDVRGRDGEPLSGFTSNSCAASSFLEEGGFGIDRRQSREIVTRLLDVAWKRMIAARGLPTYGMAGRVVCAYFTETVLGSPWVSFRGADARPCRRQLVGYRSRPKKEDEASPQKRYWHFGIDARPLVHPFYGYSIRTHVLFSSDGATIWKSKDKLHRARRILCWDWWNEDWRDRLLGALSWLSRGDEVLKLQLASEAVIAVRRIPLPFRSPVSYVPPKSGGIGVLLEEPNEDIEDEPDDEAQAAPV